jgi:glycosyltransferase involved in cell wall biosynthesis
MTNSEFEKKSLLFSTSGAPFGVTELWFQAEVRELEKNYDVILLPVWPRGERSAWPGRVLKENGRAPIRIFKLLSALARSQKLRKLLWSSKDGFNFRTQGKLLLAFFSGLLWAIEIERQQLKACHVHATTVASPSMAASVIAEYLSLSSSATGHRGDIVRCSSPASLNSLGFIRAITIQAQQMLAQRGVASIVTRFGALDPFQMKAASAPSHVLRCVAIGHLSKMKAHNRALKIVRGTHDAGVSLTLEIFGRGELEQQLREEIASLGLTEIVELKGFLPHDDLLVEMSSGRWNVLLHPSIESGEVHEGLPVAILEAAANGLSIVASNSGGTGDFLTDGVNGKVFAAEDTDEAVHQGIQALVAISRDLDLQAKLGREAMESAELYVSTNTLNAMKSLICDQPQ